MMVSIIITTFKRPILLNRAIRSVLSQTTTNDTLIELVIVDDDPLASGMPGVCSIDFNEFSCISLQYIKRGPNESGVSAARNRGIRSAHGDWILFLDDDDLLNDGAVAALINASKDSSAHFCAGGYVSAQEDLDGNLITGTFIQPKWDNYNQLMLGNIFPIGSFIIKRSCIKTLFNPALKTHEDWLFLLDNLRYLTVIVISAPVLQVRQCNEGRSHRNHSGGLRQLTADYIRIYALHPSLELLNQRLSIIRGGAPFEISDLIGGINQE